VAGCGVPLDGEPMVGCDPPAEDPAPTEEPASCALTQEEEQVAPPLDEHMALTLDASSQPDRAAPCSDAAADEVVASNSSTVANGTPDSQPVSRAGSGVEPGSEMELNHSDGGGMSGSIDDGGEPGDLTESEGVDGCESGLPEGEVSVGPLLPQANAPRLEEMALIGPLLPANERLGEEGGALRRARARFQAPRQRQVDGRAECWSPARSNDSRADEPRPEARKEDEDERKEEASGAAELGAVEIGVAEGGATDGAVAASLSCEGSAGADESLSTGGASAAGAAELSVSMSGLQRLEETLPEALRQVGGISYE